MKKLILLFLTASVFAQDIELKGVISADNNQIKNIANPTDAQDAVTKSYFDSNISSSPWNVNATNDSISYEKKVVIGSSSNQSVPALTVYGTDIGDTSPSANFIRSRYRNNVLLFETSEEDNHYVGSIGLLEASENDTWPNSFVIGVNDGVNWYNPLRIYYDNKALRFGFGSENYWDPNNFGDTSLSLGFNSISTGDYSTALGVDNLASGLNSTALGINSQANAQGAIVLGVNSVASGNNSTAIGLNANATGIGSTAIGLNVSAKGSFSSAFGIDIEAASFAETAMGRFNTLYTPIGGVDGYSLDDRLFVIGNGLGENDRSDALVIKKSGEMSLESHQIKNIADPTDDQDAVTKAYLIEKTNELLSQIEALQSHTGYPNTLIDLDGNPYEFKTYGTQIWTLSNAEVVTYRDGTPIPQVTDATEWANLTTGAWCYYDNDSTKGKLYNWYAVAGIHDEDPNTPNKEFAPTGWHVPTDAEWTELENYLIANGYNYDGTTEGNKIAKALASTDLWDTNLPTFDGGGPVDNVLLNNSSRFNWLPIGRRDSSGAYNNRAAIGWLWNSLYPYAQTIGYNEPSIITRDYNETKTQGLSVRFVKDAEIADNTDHIPDHLEVGDLWGGGIVVNIDPTRQNATIMATKEYLSPPIAFDSKAYTFSYTSPGYTNGYSQDHYGGDNTLELIKIKNDPNIDSLNEAANYCDQIVIDGYDDWYLPTFQELLYAHSNLFLEHIYFSGIELWSSIYIGDEAYKLKLLYGSSYQASNELMEKELHLGKTRALPFRTVGTIY